ncbi:MAG: type methionyl aminopeptidase [Armatimonadetes bacterium]|jgi:methionyl aminopeptidase|nr:type methionyl aminopeptidase [Armatimonadota bacterium]
MGRITYKNQRDLEKMREAGRVVSIVLAALRDVAKAGVSTHELDRIALELIRDHGGTPSFLNYRVGKRVYRHSICASLNAEVVHGIPRADRVLQEGDLIKLDVGVRLKGFHADSAITVPVGEISEEHQRLLAVTRESLWAGIRAISHRGRLQDISRAIQQHVEQHGFTIVREMVGHGVGKNLHEEPQIPNYADPKHPNPVLLEGMTLAIEPMVNVGAAEIEVLPDEWTVITLDRKASAHFEHTVAVTRGGADVLTLGPHDAGP